MVCFSLSDLVSFLFSSLFVHLRKGHTVVSKRHGKKVKPNRWLKKIFFVSFCPEENAADRPHVWPQSDFRPFLVSGSTKGTRKGTKNKEIFTRTWVWGLVLRVRVRSVRVWNVRVTSTACIYQLLWVGACVTTRAFSLPKDRLSTLSQSNLIYLYECRNCGKRYVGRTEQRLADRIDQHVPKHIITEPGTREENTWSTTEGEKQPSGGVRLCDCLWSGCKQDMQSALRGWWLFGADESEDKESPECRRGCVH